MDPRLQMEIRQLAEQYCPPAMPQRPIDRTSWIEGFCVFAELVDQLHKQMSWPTVNQPATSLFSSIWKDETTRRSNPYMSLLDQAIADHDAIRDAEIANRQRRVYEYNHELAAARAFASNPHLLQNQLDIRDGKYTIVDDPASSVGHDVNYEW